MITTTRLGSTPAVADQYIRMTSFDDDRTLADSSVDQQPKGSTEASQAAPSSTVISEDDLTLSEIPPSQVKEYHTGFFLANLILRLWDEFKNSSQVNNQLPLLRPGFRPTMRRFRHMSTIIKLNAAICASTFMFVLYILPVSVFVKLALFGALSLLNTVPVLSQFFFYGMPVLAWVFLFFSAAKVPEAWRPPISVKFLPAMENILYGDNLSDILAAYHNTFLDLLAWFPYGIVHFGGPFVVAALIWLFGPPTALRSYGWSFGYMNLLGVFIQQVGASAPPWYKNLYGLAAAHYGMSGSPGGLARIDELFGFDMYTTTFSTAPLIFGAFPSLHSACSTMSALWLSYLFPKYTACFVCYVCWLWWATMYLTHHYFFDLTAGSVLAVSFFYAAKFTSLPLKDPKCWCRFNYTQLKYFDTHAEDPLFESEELNNASGLDAGFSMVEEPVIETI
ncbi:hypothetical protein FOA43_002182 [Brettanomyces nanus]|uniref:Phosphatidic acid phosphatase type 2/haloperoxidase domain-containing protein n=1 Tax=Eeniella nana TaxID=13502 RepID=A0A875S0A8_EENNA|nr:uncharacterized protein FOA43_002182 [Brettanomyces nanus]QPG74846.1 hypothetical protein FOA43_002182 [Brettanomyces nanus]